jgi:CheY-like chemotaxis protein/HPt (histidine-containing phosphotransfer) domain-containing protein
METLQPDSFAYRLLVNMGHDIYLSIQSLMGTIEFLLDGSLNNEQAEYVRQIKFSAEALHSLVGDMLDYAQIKAGSMTLDLADFDLEQTVQDVVDSLAVEAHKKGLEITMDIPPDANIIVNGDGGKFSRILINLIKNAVESTPEGGVSITVRLTDFKGGEAVYVTVADNGPALSEEDRALLLDPFMTSKNPPSGQNGGTGSYDAGGMNYGIGGRTAARSYSALVLGLTELLGGFMEILSNEGGRGSLFRFTLPILRSVSIPEVPDFVSAARDMRILLVDDHPDPLFITSSYLGDIGYTNINCVANGEEALSALKAAALTDYPYRLCIIDLLLPIMDGRQLVVEIRKDSSIASAILILMVPQGLLGLQDRQTLLKWAEALIDKPVKRRNLAETIKLVLTVPAREPGVLAAEEAPILDAIEVVPMPALTAELSPRPGTSPSFTAGLHTQNPVVTAAKPSVLILETNRLNQKIFSLIIEKMGYLVIFADNGPDCLVRAAVNSPDLAVMDYEAAATLRKQGFKKPIIVVSAGDSEEEQRRAAGIDDVLFKPFKRDNIEQLLLKWIGSGRESPGTAMPSPSEQEIFSPEDLLETFLDNMEMVKSLLVRFLERTGEQITAIPGLVEKGEWETAHREAHTIKGSSLTLGGKELGKAAVLLEQACKDAKPAETKAAFPPVEEAFGRFKAAAEKFLAEH